MTKKKLIDLMIENNVKWPEGAEFAAQDKLSATGDFHLQFYLNKPFHTQGDDCWFDDSGSMIFDGRIRLPELCHNWHQTIVTREQYQRAMKLRDSDKRVAEFEKRKSEVRAGKPSERIGELHVDVQLSDIINKIAHHQAESQRYEEAMLDHNDKELALREHLNEMLAKVGMRAVDAEPKPTESEWPDCCDENGIVVDWDSVPAGTVVECVECDGVYSYRVGELYTFGHDQCGDYGPLDNDGHSPSYSARGGYKFRLIK